MEFWPWSILKPQEISVDPSHRNLRSSSASNGFTQVNSNSTGIWLATFVNVPVYSPEMIRLWRYIDTYTEGQANPILIPIYDWDRNPSGLSNNHWYIYNSVPHSDNSFFTDSAGYKTLFVNVKTSSEALFSTVTISVNKIYSQTLKEGQRFSVSTNDFQGDLYQIKQILTQDDTTATFKVWPNIRNTIPANTRLNFDYPVLRVRLASDNEMKLNLKINKYSETTINFIEDV